MAAPWPRAAALHPMPAWLMTATPLAVRARDVAANIDLSPASYTWTITTTKLVYLPQICSGS